MPRSPIPPKVKWTVLARDGFRCRYCGDAPPNCVLVVDHWHPVSRGGSNNPDNLVTACETCNQGKSNAEFPGLNVINVYFELGDKVLSWLGEAWHEAAGVDWDPDQDLLVMCILESESLLSAEQTVREFASHIASGEIDWHKLRWLKIMGAFECYISDVNRNSHPSLDDMTTEEIKARFWGDLEALLA